MTNKQTTKARILDLIVFSYEDVGLETEQRDFVSAAESIAAEIDDLTERNAFLLTSAETAQAKLAEARAEVERRDTYIAELAQKLDRLTAKG